MEDIPQKPSTLNEPQVRGLFIIQHHPGADQKPVHSLHRVIRIGQLWKGSPVTDYILRYQKNQWTVALCSVGDKKCSNGASAENNQARDMNDPGRLNVVPVSVQWIAPAGKSNKVASKGKFIVAADTLLLFDSFNRWRKCFLLIATIVESSGSGTARTIYNGSFTHHQFYDKLFCYTFRIKLFCAGGKWAQYWLHLACVCHNFLKCNWKHFS